MSKAVRKNIEKKIVYVDYSIITPEEVKMVETLVKCGYDLRTKSEARSKAAKDRADGLTLVKIRSELKDDQETLKKFNDTHEKEGFLNAKNVYFAWKDAQK